MWIKKTCCGGNECKKMLNAVWARKIAFRRKENENNCNILHVEILWERD